MKKPILFVYRHLMSALFYLFRMFPVKPNKVVVLNFNGGSYGDNAKYVVENLIKKKPDTDIVWLRAHNLHYPVPDFCRVVDINSRMRRIFEMATARLWMTSHYFSIYDRKRKGQVVIQFWHGGLGIKKIGENIPQTKEDQQLLRHNMKLADLFVSNSDFSDRVFREAFGYQGEILKCGYPRNDVFFHNHSDVRRKLRRRLGYQEDTRLLLYAPTFRDEGTDFEPDYELLRNAVSERFGGSWKLLTRKHPLTDGKLGDEKTSDVTDYPDMQELILASDAFLSDYSSGIFDAALMGIPCFLLMKDYDTYSRTRGVYLTPEELPFACAFDDEGLKKNIAAFDPEEQKKAWERFAEKQGLCETGQASEKVTEKILQIMNCDVRS